MPHDEVVVLNTDKGLAENPRTHRLGVISTRLLGGLATFIVVLDQVTKAIVRMMLPLHQSVEIIPGFINFTHVHNTGVAFGFLNAVDIPFKPVLMTAIALAALIAIGTFAMRTNSDEPLTKIGLALVFGGAAGNLIDRITLGYVIDFIDVYWGTWHFWAFNIADSAITVGACLLILEMALLNRHVPTSS